MHYKFKYKVDRPRDVAFAVNGVEFKRSIGDGYQQKLITGGTEIEIEDPFRASIGMFVDALRGAGAPLISPSEILENIRLQDEIIAVYREKHGIA